MLNVPFRGEILQNLSLWLAFNGVGEGTVSRSNRLSHIIQHTHLCIRLDE